MKYNRIAAIVFTVLAFVVIAFQLALAAGAPWGEFAMGGQFPGQLPPAMRVAAIIQSALIGACVLLILTRAGLILPGWTRASRRLVWLVVGFFAVSLVMNLITPSAGERALWTPVAFLMLAGSLVVAVSKPEG